MRKRVAVRWRRRWVAVVLLPLLAGSACKVRGEITVDVRQDGSGEVVAAVGLDPDAVAAAGDLSKLRLDDVKAAGWTLEPLVSEDGLSWIRARKGFSDRSQLQGVLDEVAGREGPLQDFALTTTDGFGSDTYTVTGTLDLHDGLAQFSDAGVAEALDGLPLGRSPQDLEKEFGADPGAVELRVRVRVEGDPGATNGVREGEWARWTRTVDSRRPVSESLTVSAVRTSGTAPLLFWVGVGALGLAALLAGVGIRSSVRLRRARQG